MAAVGSKEVRKVKQEGLRHACVSFATIVRGVCPFTGLSVDSVVLARALVNPDARWRSV